jgi:ribosomal protein S7
MTKFTNKFMQRGRKASVEKIAFRVFTKIRKKYHKDALKILFFSLIKTRPLLGFVTIRLSREMKQIPFPLSPRRQLIISLT